MTNTIPLTKGKFAIVDDDDYEWLLKHKWHFVNPYALRRDKKTRKIIRMHRQIMSAPDNMLVDHINHNGLDNRKSNLRVCTPKENAMNRSFQKNNTTGYKGVYFDKRQGKYHAKIRYKGKLCHIGLFKDPVDAAKAYDKEAAKLFGEFAFLNFR